MDKVYYVYSHTRLDKNEIFYIGVGTKKPKGEPYKRAKAKDGRNNIWLKIINKTDYTIEIIYETTNLERVFDKEKELIKLYGKIIDKNGTLCNISDGGEGNQGYKPSPEVIEMHRQRMIGRKASFETKEKMSKIQRNKFVRPEVGKKISMLKKGKKQTVKSDNRRKKLLHIPTNEVFVSANKAALKFGYRPNFFRRMLKLGELKDFKLISKEEFKEIIKNTGQIIPKEKTVVHSEESKLKVSLALKGRKHTEESKEKMSVAQKGKIRSEETRKKCSNSSPNNIPIRHLLTNEIFKNITDACLKYKIGEVTLSKQLRTGYSKCLFEYCNNPKPKKLTKVIRNIITNEIFFNMENVANRENLEKSAAQARTIRNSKNWNYIFDEINYIEYIKEHEELDKLKLKENE
jgi:hypothetical protein